MEKILFATDFSDTGQAALRIATSIALSMDACLIIVHVDQPLPVNYERRQLCHIPDPAHDDLWKLLEEIVPTDPRVRCEHHLLSGDTARAIIRFAKIENVDMIVMGTQGHGGLTRMLMGSVAEQVVRRAPCSVLTFKLPSGKPVKVK